MFSELRCCLFVVVFFSFLAKVLKYYWILCDKYSVLVKQPSAAFSVSELCQPFGGARGGVSSCSLGSTWRKTSLKCISEDCRHNQEHNTELRPFLQLYYRWIFLFVFGMCDMMKHCIGPWLLTVVLWGKMPNVVWTSQSVKVELYLFNQKGAPGCGSGNIRERLYAISAFQCNIWSEWERVVDGTKRCECLQCLCLLFVFLNISIK